MNLQIISGATKQTFVIIVYHYFLPPGFPSRIKQCDTVPSPVVIIFVVILFLVCLACFHFLIFSVKYIPNSLPLRLFIDY